MAPAATPTLATVLDHLATIRFLKVRRRDAVSAISRVAEMLHRAPADIPADVRVLREQLDGIHPAQHGVTAKTLSNIKSALADALTAVGLIPPADDPVGRTEKWESFLERVGAPHQAWSLSRLVAFCCRAGVEPEDVSDETIEAFRAYLDERILTKNPTRIVKENAQTWNGIVKRNGLDLAILSYTGDAKYRCASIDRYPLSLQREIDGYLNRLAHVDVFAEDGPEKPLKPMSLRNVRAHLLQYLHALVSAGANPASLASLANVVSAANMRTAFRAIMARRAVSTFPKQLNNIAATLVAIARYHLKLDLKEVDAMLAIKKRVATEPKGMSPKNAVRLSQFNDWQNVVRLVGLPGALMARAEKAPEARNSAILAMHAASLAILLSCPMRAKNLAGLDLDRHVIAHLSGTHTIYTLRIEGIEVKNGEPIEVQLNARNSRLIHTYIAKFRPLISDAAGMALFPRRSDGRPREPARLSNDLQTLIYRETGLEVHTHLFRHIAAKLYLNERPGDFETVRRLLKHKKLQTTMDFYAELSNQWAHDHYDTVVLAKFGGDRG